MERNGISQSNLLGAFTLAVPLHSFCSQALQELDLFPALLQRQVRLPHLHIPSSITLTPTMAVKSTPMLPAKRPKLGWNPESSEDPHPSRPFLGFAGFCGSSLLPPE